jgi:DNA recombination protein RmuC
MEAAIMALILALAVGTGVFIWLKSRHPSGTLLANARTVEDELRDQIARRENELVELREQLAAGNQRNGQLAARLETATDALATERKQIEAIGQKFEKEFEAISNRLLLTSADQFNKQSSKTLEAVLQPVKDELKEFKTKLDTTQKETAAHSALLKDQISRIGMEAANLAKALKGDARVIGNWGQNMLDQILEKSGLQLGIHYRRQQPAKTEDGDQRFLDVVVDLPDHKKHLVIDSKVSLKAFEQYSNCTDETLRTKYLHDHIACIRSHFRALGAKRYQDLYGINAPDFVLMYVPIEPAYFVTIDPEPTLFSEALERNVVLTTNSTLLATLRTVASVWLLAEQQRNAIEIAKRGGQLYDKFIGFIGDLENVGSALKKGQDAWETAKSKLHIGPGNLVRQVELLKELGVKASKAMPPQLKASAEEEAPGRPSLLNAPNETMQVTEGASKSAPHL